MRIAWVMAGLLCAAQARAQDRRPPAPEQQKQAEKPPPLSEQDAELVKELALLERLELLRNLELFEPDPQQKQTKQDTER
jgi:hypothetical protein